MRVFELMTGGDKVQINQPKYALNYQLLSKNKTLTPISNRAVRYKGRTEGQSKRQSF